MNQISWNSYLIGVTLTGLLGLSYGVYLNFLLIGIS